MTFGELVPGATIVYNCQSLYVLFVFNNEENGLTYGNGEYPIPYPNGTYGFANIQICEESADPVNLLQ
jgi:hypothetical protein